MIRSFRLAIVLVFIALPLAAQTPPPDDPAQLWKWLKDGNATFMAGSIRYVGLDKLRNDTDKPKGQNPPVAILSCADSRVPPELVFYKTLNQVFVVRVAGNVAGQFDLASLEYSVAQGWTKLIVVMGHSRCGAVEAALDPNDPGTPSLVALVQRIRESFGADWAAPPSLEDATKRNARASASWLPAHSAVIRDAVRNGKVRIVAAYYNLGSGLVEEVP
ncbi:MAG TPA: carbonic anhydrase [Thermoanaerobaculia bacterium]|nr:carbonic anhydrase [Thermoanaerobaculia bacterium]